MAASDAVVSWMKVCFRRSAALLCSSYYGTAYLLAITGCPGTNAGASPLSEAAAEDVSLPAVKCPPNARCPTAKGAARVAEPRPPRLCPRPPLPLPARVWPELSVTGPVCEGAAVGPSVASVPEGAFRPPRDEPPFALPRPLPPRPLRWLWPSPRTGLWD